MYVDFGVYKYALVLDVSMFCESEIVDSNGKFFFLFLNVLSFHQFTGLIKTCNFSYNGRFAVDFFAL